MADKLKSGTKAWLQRQARHRHNGLIGSACMIKAQCDQIIRSNTCHQISKDYAEEIYELANRLERSLRTTRIDP